MAAFSRRGKIKKANKALYKKLADRSAKLDNKSASQFLGMSKREFQQWLSTDIPPERFIK